MITSGVARSFPAPPLSTCGPIRPGGPAAYGSTLPLDALGRAAVRSGTISQEQLYAMNEEDKLRLIFGEGISTKAEVSTISGRGVGAAAVLFHLGGGVLYTLGAVAYARKRPDPWPRVFGYHEIYHVLVVVACGCLFDVVYRSLHHAP